MPTTWRLLALAVGTACTGLSCSGLSVSRVDNKASHASGAPGERVALPIPAFLVSPKTDGTLEVQAREFPDPDNTFALDGWSIIASHGLKVTTKGGVLTAVTWNTDTAAVLARGAKAGGAIGAEVAKAEQAEDKAKLDAKKTHDKAIADAKLDITLKELALASAKASGDKVKIAEAELALAQAREKLKAAERAPLGPFNSVERSATPPSWIPGPLVFVVEDTVDEHGQERVRLVPASAQQRAPGGECDLSHIPPIQMARPEKGDLSVAITLPCAVQSDSSVPAALTNATTQADATAMLIAVHPKVSDAAVLEVTIKSAVTAGLYDLTGSVIVPGRATPTTFRITLSIP